MAKIFISYRRDDSRYQAARLHAALKPFVADARTDIFIDIDNMPFGMDFAEHLDGKVAECEVLLAVIGPGWVDARGADGSRRLEDPDDFVRIEIASALKRGIPVVPVLLDGAPVPKAAELPDDLKPLSRRHGITVSFLSFEADVARLAGGLPPKLKGGATASASAAPVQTFRPGEVFRDALRSGGQGPQMVVIPPGSFVMGSPANEKGRNDDEGPQRTVRIGNPFAAGKFAVTWAEYEVGAAAGACPVPEDDGFGKGSRPVTNVSWDEAKAYAAWLSAETGQAYRLLSEAEWEYACRAGTTTPFSFGATISTREANYDGNSTYGSGPKGECRDKTTPVGSFPPNAFGLHDMHGNVWEWVGDCYEAKYSVQPSDGSAFTKSPCRASVPRGGSWASDPQFLRSASRIMTARRLRGNGVGFRLARMLP